MDKVELRGRAAYVAYSDAVGGVSVNGDPLPRWKDQLPRIRESWCAAGAAVTIAELRAGRE